MEAQTKIEEFELATFGAGCFWGTERFFSKEFGSHFIDQTVGFMAPTEEINIPNPDYKEMSSGRSGHIEAFHMKYRPSKVSYESLVRHFFTFHDPTTKG